MKLLLLELMLQTEFPLHNFELLDGFWLPTSFSFPSLNSIGSDESKRHSVKSVGSDSSSPGQSPLLMVDIKNFKALWNEEVYQNRERWKAQAAKGTVRAVTTVTESLN